jgi:hypothetical protein
LFIKNNRINIRNTVKVQGYLSKIRKFNYESLEVSMGIKFSGGGGNIKFSGTGGGIKIGSPTSGGGGGGAFSPSSISGLIMWMNAGAGTYSDSVGSTPAVSQSDQVMVWKDQSGFGNDFVLRSWASPLLNLAEGFAGVYFDGNSGLKSNTLNGRNPLSLGGSDIDFTIIVAWRPLAGSNNSSYAFAKGGAVDFIYSHGSNQLSFGSWNYTGGEVSYDAAAHSSNSRMVQTLKAVTSTSNFSNSLPVDRYGYVNGNLLVTAPNSTGIDNLSYWNPAVDASHPIELGSQGYSANGCLVYEILFYNKALNDTERANVENYLKTKYSV